MNLLTSSSGKQEGRVVRNESKKSMAWKTFPPFNGNQGDMV